MTPVSFLDRGPGPWLRAFLPIALCAAAVLGGREMHAGRIGNPGAPACAADTLQPWLAARLAKVPTGAGARDERTLFLALMQTGQKQFDRYIVARALQRGDGARNELGALMPELDEAALLPALRAMPAFQRLEARIKAHPGRGTVTVEVPGAKRPQALDEAVAPETSNALLEAMRSTPVVTEPPQRREIDVIAELPALVALLGDDVVKSRVLARQYREHPAVFSDVFARHRKDAAFVTDLGRMLGHSFGVLMQDDLAGVVPALRARLERNGFPGDRLRLLATENPEAFDDIVASHLKAQLADPPLPEWRMRVAGGALTAFVEAGHFSFGWKLPLRSLALGKVEGAERKIAIPPPVTRLVRRCFGDLCLPEG